MTLFRALAVLMLANCGGGDGVLPWPAESMADAVNLTPVGPQDWEEDLSGAVWDDANQRLWVCTNEASNSGVWALLHDADGEFKVDEIGGEEAQWRNFGDLESLTLVDNNRPTELFLMIEGTGSIQHMDFSIGGQPAVLHSWNITVDVPSADGSEALTFVPDAFLEGVFVDGEGVPTSSTLGMGGLMIVGHQSDGALYVFDLNPNTDDDYRFVGRYETAATETAGLDFDATTGLLFILHGGDFNDVEVAMLSSSVVGGVRRLDAVAVVNGTDPLWFASNNYEGLALGPAGSCDQPRELFLTVDGGGPGQSLMLFKNFPSCF
jgi:hypothetical protein